MEEKRTLCPEKLMHSCHGLLQLRTAQKVTIHERADLPGRDYNSRQFA